MIRFILMLSLALIGGISAAQAQNIFLDPDSKGGSGGGSVYVTGKDGKGGSPVFLSNGPASSGIYNGAPRKAATSGAMDFDAMIESNRRANMEIIKRQTETASQQVAQNQLLHQKMSAQLQKEALQQAGQAPVPGAEQQLEEERPVKRIYLNDKSSVLKKPAKVFTDY